MADPYRVVIRRGDHLFKIAAAFNVSKWSTIWDANQELRSKPRKNPNQLCDGDELLVPVPEDNEEPGATEANHPFQMPGSELQLRLRLLNSDFSPLADLDYSLEVVDGDGHKTALQGRTDAKGQLSQAIPPASAKATLTARVPLPAGTKAPPGSEIPMTWNLWIGALHPMLEPAPDDACLPGVQQRLNNLGFDCGEVTGQINENTKAAIRAFRRKFGLPDGDSSDEALQNKLREVHDLPDSIVKPTA